MTSRNFRAKCPCCDEWLDVDVKLRRLESKNARAKDDPLDTNKLVDEHKQAQDNFFQALEDERRSDKPGFEDYLD